MPSTIPLMIDSGAFSVGNRKGNGKTVEPIDIHDYIAFCKEVKKDFPNVVCVNLDVVDEGRLSYRNWKIMLDAGVRTLPVYHVTTDEMWLAKYCAQTDYVGIGAIARAHDSKRAIALDRVWERYLVDEDRMPTHKVHGMGITSFTLMKRYPWYSLDSTSWFMVAMYGHLCIPRRRHGRWDFGGQALKITFSEKGNNRKVKNKHIENLSPPERRDLLAYCKEMGFPLGESKPRSVQILGKRVLVHDDPRITEVGLSNNFEMRALMNLEYYARFQQEHPWPRALPPTHNGFEVF